MTSQDGKKSVCDGVKTITDGQQRGWAAKKNGQLGQSGVRAIDRAPAGHKEQVGTKRGRRELTAGRGIGRELGSAQTTAGCEVRTTIINRRACDRSRAGSAQAIAWYEVRGTKSNRRARNRSTIGSTVGGYLETIRSLRQLVLAQSGVT
jgi:hypothetical protein